MSLAKLHCGVTPPSVMVLFKLVYSFDWFAYLLFWLGYLFIGMVDLVSLAFGIVYLLHSYLFDLHEKEKLSSSSHIPRKYGN